MKNKIRLSENYLFNMVKRIINESTKEEWLSRYDNYDTIKNRMNEIDTEINYLMSEKNKLYNKISNLPKITLYEVYPSLEDGNGKKVPVPHIRAAMSFDHNGKRGRTNIYVGKLEEFPGGSNDNNAIRIAREKVYTYLSKNFPFLID